MASDEASERPGWADEYPWLRGLLELAQEEARERGDALVAGHHVALALIRDAGAGRLLQTRGIEARVWRDYINFVLGVRAGTRARDDQRLRPGYHRTPAETYHHGPVRPTLSALAVLKTAHHEAERAHRPVSAAHVLVALAAGGGGIGTGTAWWVGVGPAAVRRAAALPAPVPQPTPVTRRRLPRPKGKGALVLFGGGELPAEALSAVLPKRAGAAQAVARLVVVGAADYPDVATRRRVELQAMLGDVEVVDAGLTDRDAAHSAVVVDRLAHADVVFLDGGRPERLYQALAGTPALRTIVRASDRGAIVVGYSAGSQALGDGCRRGGWAEPYTHDMFGWLEGFVIVPHCSGSAMLEELRATMAAFPGRRGLGIAHAGAILMRPGCGQIEGLSTGYAQGSVVLDHPNARPHLLCNGPYTLP